MKSINWDFTHLGKKVRFVGKKQSEWHYRLLALTYNANADSVIATLETIVPSPRPGLVSHHELESIELVK